MSEATMRRLEGLLNVRRAMDAAQEHPKRKVRPEHARTGQSVCESRDGRDEWLAPEEIFSRSCLDEYGKPKA